MQHSFKLVYFYMQTDNLYFMFQARLNIDGLVQERHNSSALAMELRLSCTNQ